MENDLVQRIEKLSIHQKQLVSDLIDEITNNSEDNTDNKERKRIGNPHFVTPNGTALAIGDTVKVLSNRKTGKHGDLATIIKFNKTLVAIQLQKNGSHTQRASKYLEYKK